MRTARAITVATMTASMDSRLSLGPVDVSEVQPEREVAQRQCRPRAEEQRQDPRHGESGAEQSLKQAHDEDEQDAPDPVGDVDPADVDVLDCRALALVPQALARWLNPGLGDSPSDSVR